MKNSAENRFIWLPTAEQELMLKAGLSKDSSAVTAWQNWKNIRSPHRTVEAENRLFPLIYHNLQKLEYFDEATEFLKKAHRAAFIDTRLQLQKATTTAKAFSSNGIRTILLKGAAVGIAYYESIVLRPMSDIDFLIDRNDLPKAVRVLGDHGFLPENGNLSLATDIINAWHFETSSGDVVDVHWQLMRDCWNADKVEMFWNAAVTFEYDSVKLETLCATDHLFHACCHGARYNPVAPIRWIPDVMMILDSSEIDWSRLYELGKMYRLNLLLFHSLSYLRDTFSAPVPDHYLQEVKQTRTTSLERMSFRHFSQPPQPWTTKRYAEELIFQYSTLRGKAFLKYLHFLTSRKLQQWSAPKPDAQIPVRSETKENLETELLSDRDLRKLLLKFVLSDGPESLAAFAAWERHVVFDNSSFQSFKLLSAVYPKLLRHDIPSRLFLRIKGAYRRTWAENQLLLKHLGDLFEDLNNLRINFIIADEAFRLTEIYNDLGIFSLQNFVVMAPVRQRKEFCQRLIKNLWEISDDRIGRTRCTRDKALCIDVLWADNKTFDDRSREAISTVVGNKLIPIVRAEEQILDLCESRFMFHGDEESDWQFIAGALFNSGKIDSSKLIEFAQRRHLTREAANMIDALSSDFDVRAPVGLSTELRNIRPPGKALLIEERIKNLRKDYRIYLEYETRNGSKAGFVDFIERRWEADSYTDLIKQGIRSCVRLLQAK